MTEVNGKTTYTRARFFKCALQVNPASYITYRGEQQTLSEAEYNLQLLNAALEAKIDVIGLADHGSVEGVDQLRNLFSEHGVVVFPGFEIASSEKIHFVCLFAENKTSQELEQQTALQNRQAQLDELFQQRSRLLLELSQKTSERSSAMRKSMKRLNKKLDQKVSLTLQSEANRQIFVTFLESCKLEGVGSKRLEWVEKGDFSPANLAATIRDDDIAGIHTKFKATPAVAQVLGRMSESQLLLDNAFIAERIVSELRSAKLTRQFLFAAHNANIPVFGDAEWIGVLSVEDNKGHILPAQQGAIDVPAIQKLAAEILEGGKSAFNQRREKYGFD